MSHSLRASALRPLTSPRSPDVVTVGAIDSHGARSVWSSTQKSSHGALADPSAPGTVHAQRRRAGAGCGKRRLGRAAAPTPVALNIVHTCIGDLPGEALNGTWNLRINDSAVNDIRDIDRWHLMF